MKKERRIWITLLVFGLLGQLAWTVENMYFNIFVYNTLSGDVDVIAAMVALSAITATVTTLLMGAVSDKLGKRKIFITLGYFIWGLTVIAFSFINLENIAKFFPHIEAATAGGIFAIVLDCIMTFFGSTANDAAFNAWITDEIDNTDRSKYEAVLATLPLISMIIVFGLLDGFTQQGRWDIFFLIVGSSVSLGGLFGMFFLKETVSSKSKESLLSNILYGFKPSVVKENKRLYLSFACLLTLSIATQVFMPYFIIYIQAYLQINDYALILAAVLIVSSVISVLFGRVIDKLGTFKVFVPATLTFVVGLVMMFFARKMLTIIFSGIVMMSGNLILTAIIHGSIRNYTPEDKAGLFQGIRMIFMVMLPMIIGPVIGALVIKNSGNTYVDLGVVKEVPTPAIWLASAIVALLILVPFYFLSKEDKKQKKNHNKLLTEYGDQLDINNVLPEYPRPQLVRDSYINLNGIWKYAINQSDEIPSVFDGDVIVPYAIESVLSRVNRTITPKDVLWYKKEFTLPEGFNKGLVHLHFGAVDQICKVYINQQLAGEHVGGYLPFSFEISEFLQEKNELIVYVKDLTDTSYHSKGKQSSKRGGIWYTPISGIWQTVWLESTPVNYIESLRISIDYDLQTVNLDITGNDEKYIVTVKEENKTIFNKQTETPVSIKLDNVRSWTPENPFLYDLIVSNGKDTVNSYFGMRKFSVASDKYGIKRLMLNNQPYFHKGILDQGYYSDGIYTPASYRQMEDDIRMLKDMGFNTIRKHIKIDPLYFYYLCDKMGMLVWQDMVNGGSEYSDLIIGYLPYLKVLNIKDSYYGLFARNNKEGREEFIKEMKETVDLLYNTVSLALWVPFNEGWGQFDAIKIAELLRSWDSSRTIDHASGWHDQKGGDLFSKHIYFDKIKFEEDERVWALTEYGGYSWAVKGHTYNNANFGYQVFSNKLDLQSAFIQLHNQQIIPLIEKGLSAIIYTQLSDVEDEVNGLVTYDRKIIKFDTNVIKIILDKMQF
ncbi:MAG: MFS transporter [Erysipelotrichaceae bacterium]|jgi:MFS family permease